MPTLEERLIMSGKLETVRRKQQLHSRASSLPSQTELTRAAATTTQTPKSPSKQERRIRPGLVVQEKEGKGTTTNTTPVSPRNELLRSSSKRKLRLEKQNSERIRRRSSHNSHDSTRTLNVNSSSNNNKTTTNTIPQQTSSPKRRSAAGEATTSTTTRSPRNSIEEIEAFAKHMKLNKTPSQRFKLMNTHMMTKSRSLRDMFRHSMMNSSSSSSRRSVKN